MRRLAVNAAVNAAVTVTLAAGVAALAAGGCANSVDGEDGVFTEVNPTADGALSMPPCGSVLASFDGTAAYSNGGDTGSGWSCNGVGSYGYQYQCVELVMRHFKTHFGLRWYGNARDLLDNAPRDQVEVRGNGDAAHPPVPGDMVVWKNGTWGHVALVTGVHDGGVDVIEQNVSGPGTATLPWDGATIGARWGSWVPAGWAHAKANAAAPPPAPPPPASTGVDWSCAGSSYAGGQYWTCSGGDAYRCEGGVPERAGCQAGCYGRSLGQNDVCIDDGPGWSCSGSAWNGRQLWTCSGSTLHKCVDGAPVKVDCPRGCRVNALGTDDGCF